MGQKASKTALIGHATPSLPESTKCDNVPTAGNIPDNAPPARPIVINITLELRPSASVCSDGTKLAAALRATAETASAKMTEGTLLVQRSSAPERSEASEDSVESAYESSETGEGSDERARCEMDFASVEADEETSEIDNTRTKNEMIAIMKPLLAMQERHAASRDKVPLGIVIYQLLATLDGQRFLHRHRKFRLTTLEKAKEIRQSLAAMSTTADTIRLEDLCEMHLKRYT